MPLVTKGCTVLTVTQNHAEIIDDFAESASNLSDVDIFVVDDHSSDATPDIVSHYSDQQESIHFLEYRGPRSIVRALNFGLSEMDSETVIIVQPTVRLSGNLIEQMLDALDKSPHLDGVMPELSRELNPFGSYAKFPDYRDGLIGGFHFPENWFSRLRHHVDSGKQDHLTEISWCNSPVLCLRTENFERIGFFDESFTEDLYQLDWLFRLHKDSGKIAQIPGLYCEFISNHQKKFSLRHFITSHVGLFKYFEKHYDSVHHQVFNLIVGAVIYLMLPVKLVIRLIKMKIL
ncbi:MAG: glycosyltransferase [Candidatus Marinimicrobia bacterium]|nr:glycosyltransferase [Candidatus Neomarinimicrobiota bacterium]